MKRFYSLDVLRGVAALSVVFWHWQHFFPGSGAHGLSLEGMPLVDVFFLPYAKGWLAVELFFSLSGFIFFWLYAQPVGEGRVPARTFFLLRFSRLYPLHFATLLLVAAGQLLYFRATQDFFVYPKNDGYHLLLNLFFVSSWGFERGWSFNAPVWSVSVEVFLYLLFFTVCRLWQPRLLGALALAIIGFAAVRHLYAPIGRGIGGFYLGACAYLAYEWIVRRGRVALFAGILFPLAAGGWIAALLITRDFLYGTRLLGDLGQMNGYWPTVLVLFPLTVLALALLETCRGSLGKRLAFLGEISYSSYLLHFPLQLAFALAAIAFSLDRVIFQSPLVLGGFFAVLVALSLASYRWFEAPLQRSLRGMGSGTTRMGERI